MRSIYGPETPPSQRVGSPQKAENEVRAFLPLGPATFTLERLTIDDTSAQGAPALDATSLRFTTDLRLDADGVLISGEQTLAADSVSVAPDVTVRDAAATYRLSQSRR